MKYSLTISVAIIIFILSGCGSGKQLTQKNTDAEAYYVAGNYTEALASFKDIISIYEQNNNSQECSVYTKAGESALILNNSKLAIDYLKKATYTRFAVGSTYYNLAKAYESVDNLSLEIVALTDYLELFPEGSRLIEVKTRLFYTYVESDNYEKALDLWNDVIENNPNDISLLEANFGINRAINNMTECNSVAEQILSIDSDNILALTWFGKQYYRKAEDLYQKEMKAYNSKKTNKQYKILLNALDIVTADFKKSLKYFKVIYGIDPTPENANYLSHIYGRLSDKKKSEYYKKLAN